MIAGMNVEPFDLAVKSYMKRAPFRPFVIEMKHGESITVTHPEAVATHVGLAVFWNQAEGHVLFDADSVARITDAKRPKKSAKP